MNYLQSALQYHAAGLKVIPFKAHEDGRKTFPQDYAKYRENQTEADVRELFSREVSGVCLLCTDGIEAIDIDVKHDKKGTIAKDLRDSLKTFGMMDMPAVIQKTKSGGYHFIYRTEAPDGNLKLAKRAGEKEAMIETRGKGGLLFVAPTPGYELHGDLANIPFVDQEKRNELIRICRHFDEPDPVKYAEKVDTKAKALPGVTPWDAFDATTDIQQVMESYGWGVIGKNGDYIRLNRPGAKHSKGVDGTIISWANLFYPFTTSVAFEPNKAYSPSSVYAILEHGGDFSKAARDLYKKGFGDRIEKKDEQKQVDLPSVVSKVESTRFDITKKIEEPKALLKYEGPNRVYPIGGRGMIGVFSGHEKSGKSFVGSCIAASGLAGGAEKLNFSLDLDGGTMLWFDTEQSGYFYHKTQVRIHQLAGLSENAPNYSAFLMRQLTASERVEAIGHYIKTTQNLSVVMIDGFVDLLADYNDLKATQENVQQLMKWSDEYNILIMGVLHVNKGDGKVRGHIGSELKNKCDWIINTAKADGYFTVSNPTSRYTAFPDQEFSRDDFGNPVYKSNNVFAGIPGPGISQSLSTQFPVKDTFTPQRPSVTDDIPF